MVQAVHAVQARMIEVWRSDVAEEAYHITVLGRGKEGGA